MYFFQVIRWECSNEDIFDIYSDFQQSISFLYRRRIHIATQYIEKKLILCTIIIIYLLFIIFGQVNFECYAILL